VILKHGGLARGPVFGLEGDVLLRNSWRDHCDAFTAEGLKGGMRPPGGQPTLSQQINYKDGADVEGSRTHTGVCNAGQAGATVDETGCRTSCARLRELQKYPLVVVASLQLPPGKQVGLAIWSMSHTLEDRPGGLRAR
jgi:hypothetical protein